MPLKISSLIISLFLFTGCGNGELPYDAQKKTVPKTTGSALDNEDFNWSFDFFGGDDESIFDSFWAWWDDEDVVEDANYTPVQEDESWYDYFFGSDDTQTIDNSSALEAALNDLALTSSNKETFTVDAIDLSVAYVVKEYFPDFMGETLLGLDFLKGENLAQSSDLLVEYVQEIYQLAFDSNTLSRASRAATTAVDTSISLIERIIQEIYNTIYNWLFGSDEPTPPTVVDPTDLIDPTLPVSFDDINLISQTYYIASSTYMTITTNADGVSGYGDIGFGVGSSFTYAVNNGILTLDLDGTYTLVMDYLDPGYCVAVTMTDDATQDTYEAYWFTDETQYDKADNLSRAKDLCYAHSSAYVTPIVAKDGVLEPIKDERSNHKPVAVGTTKSIVQQLVQGVANIAQIVDAKYFARKLRHGILSIYTTNGQTDTLQATETAKIKRELLPLAVSSVTQIQTLLDGAYTTSTAFQEEVNSDLNESFTELNDRTSALITTVATALAKTDASTNGDETSSFGDRVQVILSGTSLTSSSACDSRLCVKADVTLTITNNDTINQRFADVTFTSTAATALLGDSDIRFSEVTTNSNNIIRGNGYNLNINFFSFLQSTGVMTLKGVGYIEKKSEPNISRFTSDNYQLTATFTENSNLDFTLHGIRADINGTLVSRAKRNFTGNLVFDEINNTNSNMNGVLIGIGEEPTIDGKIQTSLNYTDVSQWLDDTNSTSTSLDSLGDQSYAMEVNIYKDKANVFTHMLVQKNNTSWKYSILDFNASDTHGFIAANRINFTQNGENNVTDTLNKLAINGLSDADVNTLINIGWDVVSDFDSINIEGLTFQMTPPSGAVSLQADINVSNNQGTMSADANTKYDYNTTHLTGKGHFETTVTQVNNENSYDNIFIATGFIKVDNIFNYRYAIDYTDAEQYMLFTREDSSYQMGFTFTPDTILGGDSYGVKANFTMNNSYTILDKMELTNTDDNPLGIYDRAQNALGLIFADGVKEYLYLY